MIGKGIEMIIYYLNRIYRIGIALNQIFGKYIFLEWFLRILVIIGKSNIR